MYVNVNPATLRREFYISDHFFFGNIIYWLLHENDEFRLC